MPVRLSHHFYTSMLVLNTRLHSDWPCVCSPALPVPLESKDLEALMLSQLCTEGGRHAVIRPQGCHAPVTPLTICIAALGGGGGVTAGRCCWRCDRRLVLQTRQEQAECGISMRLMTPHSLGQEVARPSGWSVVHFEGSLGGKSLKHAMRHTVALFMKGAGELDGIVTNSCK